MSILRSSMLVETLVVPAKLTSGYCLISIMESMLRTVNNLLERLHASFFFYILVNASTFLKIGFFLPAAVILSVAMMFSGLREWVDASYYQVNFINENEGYNRPPSVTWANRPRPVLKALLTMTITHAGGSIVFFALRPIGYSNVSKHFTPA